MAEKVITLKLNTLIATVTEKSYSATVSNPTIAPVTIYAGSALSGDVDNRTTINLEGYDGSDFKDVTEFYRPLPTDTATTSESKSVTLTKFLNDSFTIYDIVDPGANRVDAPIVTTSDVLTYTIMFNRIIHEGPFVWDDYFAEEYVKLGLYVLDDIHRAINPGRVEVVSTIDAYKMDLSNLREETVNTTDSISRTVSFTRIFQDFVDATDDVLGQANVDDDQYVNFFKNTKEYPTVTDSMLAYGNSYGAIDYAVPGYVGFLTEV